LIAKSKATSSYDLLNARDIKKFLANWHDECTWCYPGNVSASGEFKGKKAVEDWFQKFLDQFEGVTVITLKFGKATHAQDFFLATDEEMRQAWGD
jgi:ketosteroid isomerase-like protein